MVKPEATGLYQNAQAYIMYYRIHPYSAFWHLVSHLGEAIMPSSRDEIFGRMHSRGVFPKHTGLMVTH